MYEAKKERTEVRIPIQELSKEEIERVQGGHDGQIAFDALRQCPGNLDVAVTQLLPAVQK